MIVEKSKFDKNMVEKLYVLQITLGVYTGYDEVFEELEVDKKREDGNYILKERNRYVNFGVDKRVHYKAINRIVSLSKIPKHLIFTVILDKESNKDKYKEKIYEHMRRDIEGFSSKLSLLKNQFEQIGVEEELYDADPNCKHIIVEADGGGVECTKCGGWFCYQKGV